MKFRYHILSSFWMKLLALFLMTIDHIAKFMFMNGVANNVANIFQIIGRLGFPLFVLLLVEGVRHTRNFGKYMMRMGIVAFIVLIAQIVIHHAFMDIYGLYSPLIDLMLCGLILYLLKQNNRKSFWAIIPIAYIVLSFVVMSLEEKNNIDIWWFPFYLRSGYNIFALLLALGFYYAHPLAKIMLRHFGSEANQLEDTAYERVMINALMCFGLFFTVGIIYFLSLLPGGDIYYIAHESYALLAAVPLFLYSGELGYNKNWFKYGAYVYFPLHIVVIFLIFLLI